MINHIRLDERLIHGQVAIKWSRHTGVSHIVVANDAASESPLIQKTLKITLYHYLKKLIYMNTLMICY